MQIDLIIARSDNYVALIRDPASGHVAVVDAPDSASIIAALDARGWSLDTILVTHQHFDHIEGIPALVARYGAKVIAPRLAAAALPGADRFVGEGDRVEIGDLVAEVWETPGHCDDHISYHFAREQVIFVGDTLFTMGCGRIFGAPPEVLHRSIQRIATLSDATRIYSGHEYTLGNAKFCAAIEPENTAIAARYEAIKALRASGGFTVPSTIAEEKATNVFIRARDAAEFALRREAKNRF
jgi:hydroxyacylglutathione hydrolase